MVEGDYQSAIRLPVRPKVMRIYILNIVWAVGLIINSIPVAAQSLFPGIGQDPNLKTWSVMFVVGAAFSVIMWYVKRMAAKRDELDKELAAKRDEADKQMAVNMVALSSSITSLTLESKLHRQEASAYQKMLDIHSKLINSHTDWINKHNLMHAKCPACPDDTNDIKSE